MLTLCSSRGHGQIIGDYLENSKGERMFTEGLIVEALRRQYPKHYLSVTPAAIADLLAFAQSNDEVSVFHFVHPPVYVPVIIDTGSVKS